jgi:hypothetical protein
MLRKRKERLCEGEKKWVPKTFCMAQELESCEESDFHRVSRPPDFTATSTPMKFHPDIEEDNNLTAASPSIIVSWRAMRLGLWISISL